MDNLLRNMILGVVSFWFFAGLVLFFIPERGTFGDMFGAVNTLFSGLAFACLIYTINLQKTELSLQREELAETRSELRGQKDLMAVQNRQVALQNFEGTFFQMMRLHYELLAAIDLNVGSVNQPSILAGRDCFSHIWQRCHSALAVRADGGVQTERISKVRQQYAAVSKTYESDLDHYFRSLFNIVKFVDQSSIEDKRRYTNIVRAQLSRQELLILMYNTIALPESKFKPLIESYALFKHLPGIVRLSPDDYGYFSKEAFGAGYPAIPDK